MVDLADTLSGCFYCTGNVQPWSLTLEPAHLARFNTHTIVLAVFLFAAQPPCSPTTMQPNHHAAAAGTSTAWTASHAFVSPHFSEDAPSNQMVWLKHKKTGAANAATPVSDVIQELKIRNRLLIQLLFDGFLAIFGAEGSPKSVWTFTAGATFPTTSITVVTAISDVILITSLN